MPEEPPPSDEEPRESPTLRKITDTERAAYNRLFEMIDTENAQFIPGKTACSVLRVVGLSKDQMCRLWYLSDVDSDGRLSSEEWAIACHLCRLTKEGLDLSLSIDVFELVPEMILSSSLKVKKNRVGNYEKLKLRLIKWKERRKREYTQESRRLELCKEKLELVRKWSELSSIGKESDRDLASWLSRETDRLQRMEQVVSRLRKEHERIRQETVKVILEEPKFAEDQKILKREQEVIEAATSEKRTKATKEPDPFHELHELRKEKREKGSAPIPEISEVGVGPNPFYTHAGDTTLAPKFDEADDNFVTENLREKIGNFGDDFIANFGRESEKERQQKLRNYFMVLEPTAEDLIFKGITAPTGAMFWFPSYVAPNNQTPRKLSDINSRLVNIKCELSQLNDDGTVLVFKNPEDYTSDSQSEPTSIDKARNFRQRLAEKRRHTSPANKVDNEHHRIALEHRKNRHSLNLDQQRVIGETLSTSQNSSSCDSLIAVTSSSTESLPTSPRLENFTLYKPRHTRFTPPLSPLSLSQNSLTNFFPVVSELNSFDEQTSLTEAKENKTTKNQPLPDFVTPINCDKTKTAVKANLDSPTYPISVKEFCEILNTDKLISRDRRCTSESSLPVDISANSNSDICTDNKSKTLQTDSELISTTEPLVETDSLIDISSSDSIAPFHNSNDILTPDRNIVYETSELTECDLVFSQPNEALKHDNILIPQRDLVEYHKVHAEFGSTDSLDVNSEDILTPEKHTTIDYNKSKDFGLTGSIDDIISCSEDITPEKSKETSRNNSDLGYCTPIESIFKSGTPENRYKRSDLSLDTDSVLSETLDLIETDDHTDTHTGTFPDARTERQSDRDSGTDSPPPLPTSAPPTLKITSPRFIPFLDTETFPTYTTPLNISNNATMDCILIEHDSNCTHTTIIPIKQKRHIDYPDGFKDIYSGELINTKTESTDEISSLMKDMMQNDNITDFDFGKHEVNTEPVEEDFFVATKKNNDQLSPPCDDDCTDDIIVAETRDNHIEFPENFEDNDTHIKVKRCVSEDHDHAMCELSSCMREMMVDDYLTDFAENLEDHVEEDIIIARDKNECESPTKESSNKIDNVHFVTSQNKDLTENADGKHRQSRRNKEETSDNESMKSSSDKTQSRSSSDNDSSDSDVSSDDDEGRKSGRYNFSESYPESVPRSLDVVDAHDVSLNYYTEKVETRVEKHDSDKESDNEDEQYKVNEIEEFIVHKNGHTLEFIPVSPRSSDDGMKNVDRDDQVSPMQAVMQNSAPISSIDEYFRKNDMEMFADNFWEADDTAVKRKNNVKNKFPNPTLTDTVVNDLVTLDVDEAQQTYADNLTKTSHTKPVRYNDKIWEKLQCLDEEQSDYDEDHVEASPEEKKDDAQHHHTSSEDRTPEEHRTPDDQQQKTITTSLCAEVKSPILNEYDEIEPTTTPEIISYTPPPKVDVYSKNVIQELDTTETVDRDSIANLDNTRKQWEQIFHDSTPPPATTKTTRNTNFVRHWSVRIPKLEKIAPKDCESAMSYNQENTTESVIAREIRLSKEREDTLRREHLKFAAQSAKESRQMYTNTNQTSPTQMSPSQMSPSQMSPTQSDDMRNDHVDGKNESFNNNVILIEDHYQNEMTEADQHFVQVPTAQSEVKSPSIEGIIQREIREQQEREQELQSRNKCDTSERNNNNSNTQNNDVTPIKETKNNQVVNELPQSAEKVIEIHDLPPVNISANQSVNDDTSSLKASSQNSTSKKSEAPAGESLIAKELREMREREEELLNERRHLYSEDRKPDVPQETSMPSVKRTSVEFSHPPVATWQKDVKPFITPGKKTMSVESDISSHSSLHTGSICSSDIKIVETSPPIAEHKVHKNETPIEREIRLATEREQEYRQSKGLCVVDGVKSPSPTMKSHTAEVVRSSQSESYIGTAGTRRGSARRQATNRLHNEIVTDKQREEALRKDGSILTISEERIEPPALAIFETQNRDVPVKRNFQIKSKSSPVTNNTASPVNNNTSMTNPPVKRFGGGKANFSYKETRQSAESIIEKELREMREREKELKERRTSDSNTSPRENGSLMPNNSSAVAQWEQRNTTF